VGTRRVPQNISQQHPVMEIKAL